MSASIELVKVQQHVVGLIEGVTLSQGGGLLEYRGVKIMLDELADPAEAGEFDGAFFIYADDSDMTAYWSLTECKRAIDRLLAH